MRASRVLILLLAPILAGCLSADEDLLRPEGNALVYRTLLRDANAGFRTPFEGTLSPGEWSETWDRFAAGRSPAPPRPIVDPSREIVAAVALGVKPVACYQTTIVAVTSLNEETVVWYERYASDGDLCPTSLVEPAHVIAIADPPTPIRFVGADTTDARPISTQVDARDLARGSFSGIHRDVREAISNETAWETLWAEHGVSSPMPDVDFATERVIAVVIHPSTGCADAHIGTIAHDVLANETVVEVVFERADGIQCLVAYEDPYHFLAVPLREGGVRFFDAEALA